MPPSKMIREILVYAGYMALVGVLRCLPIERASALGGWTGRTFGARGHRHARAHKHLIHVFGDTKSQAEREEILHKMWDNMGRIFAETLIMPRLLAEHDRFEMTDAELAFEIKDDGIGAVFVGGHYGNWEVAMWPPNCFGQNPVGIYRRIGNSFVDRHLYKIRSQMYPGGLLLKDGLSAPKLIQVLKKGAHIGILCDQRERRGMVLPFLGKPAPTMGLPALLAHRLDVPLVAGRLIRLPNVRFRFECVKIPIDTSKPLKDEVKTAMGRVNDLFSQWILEHPEQWLWSHRRWDLVEVAEARENERRQWPASSGEGPGNADAVEQG